LPEIDQLFPIVLKSLTFGLLEENARLTAENDKLREEIARLQGLKGKPSIKPSVPSGMEKATEKQSRQGRREKRRRGAKRPSVAVEDQVIVAPEVPPESQFKSLPPRKRGVMRTSPSRTCGSNRRWCATGGNAG
jgi:hypothetical protein